MWQVIGHNRIVSLLQQALVRGPLAHAYLLVGPAHVGKMTLALNLAQALNCQTTERPCGECDSCQKIASANHADVEIIGLLQNTDSSDTKLRAEISIDQIRQMQHSASLPPFEGSYKTFIIEGAEFLSHEAANCLLKTLEEPVDKVVFILLTINDSLFPATVVSRCQRLQLRPLAIAEVESALNSRWGVEPQRAQLLSRLSHGCLGWALSAVFDEGVLQLQEEEMARLLNIINNNYTERFTHAAQLAAQFTKNRAKVYHVLDLWLDYWRDLMLVKIGLSDIITNVDRLDVLTEMARGFKLVNIKAFINSIRVAVEQLKHNANPRLVLEVLMLDIPGKERSSEANLTADLSVNYG